MEALLAATDTETEQGRCEAAVLAFMYNTGARVSEVAQLTVGDLQLDPRRRSYSLVTLLGKGGKTRQCPLWDSTASTLADLIDGRAPTAPVFVNRQGQAFTRSGLRKLVQRCAARAAADEPSLATKRVSPHVIRHTSATHLLRSGVDINTIRVWLGHARLDTTTVYAEIDLETKARAIANCDLADSKPRRPWKADKGTMAFLRTL
jgi:site-specific recombinase XerD